MQAEDSPLLQGASSTPGSSSALGDLIGSLMGFQAVVLVLFGLFTTYNPGNKAGVDPNTYSMLLDISVMIFIGFGYLMTFLKKYGYGAVGFTFCISAVVIEWAILNVGFWGCVGGKGNSFGVNCSLPEDPNLNLPRFGVGIGLIIQGMFAAAAVMISFGALIGKASFDQMVVLALVETTAYSLNAYIYFEQIKALDVGGSVVIHTFGAYFGLAASTFITPKDKKKRKFGDMCSTYHSDLFAFIGTVFLWIYWPSFNGVTADPEFQERVIVNTMLGLLSSCIVSFFCSRRFRGGVFDAVDIQNATLAGGVAMGTACQLPLEPYGAIILGGLAGLLSCVGYAFLLDILERKGVHDTCGVNNLHGMPGLLGGLSGVLMTGVATATTARDQHFQHGQGQQWMYQLLGLVVTIVVAIVTGAATGALADSLVPWKHTAYYTDECHWTVPTGELTFTKEDTNNEAPRRQSMRMRRTSTQNWSRATKVLSAVNRLRASMPGRVESDQSVSINE